MRTTFLLAALTQLVALPVLAASATSTLSVTANVGAVCNIATLPVAFGTYDPVAINSGADLDGTGSVTVACTKGTLASVDLGNGANFSGLRRMSGRADFLKYALYKDSVRTQVWGSGLTGGTTAAYFALNKNAATLTVYGTIMQAQDVAIGSYSDSVVASINY